MGFRWRGVARSLAVLMLFAFAGCNDGSPKIVPVAGQVLIDGQPLRAGYIRFLPTGSRSSGSSLDKEGRFNLTCYQEGDGAAVGVHQVEVSSSEMISPTQIRWNVPKKYLDASASGLKYEVVSSTENAVIQLSWDGGRPFIEVVERGEGE